MAGHLEGGAGLELQITKLAPVATLVGDNAGAPDFVVDVDVVLVRS